ncbi:zinc finger CCCH-type antiviral protein 1-like [Littorina saxatilis]|uniref:Poly [ADP-ribose] polymerase n=1 Tax=Littorina saxatilis TaxID=31220 RepID=A0AAN9AUM0_9CAEN
METRDLSQSRGGDASQEGERRYGNEYKRRGSSKQRFTHKRSEEEEEYGGDDSDGDDYTACNSNDRRGRRGRDRRGRGRGDKHGYDQSGGREKPAEVHIHHYYSNGPDEASQYPPPQSALQGGMYPPPSMGYHQPYHGPPPPPPICPISYPNQPPISYPSQPGYQPPYSAHATFGEPFPAHPTFGHAGQWPPPALGQRPPLLGQPPLYPSTVRPPYQQSPPEQCNNSDYHQLQQNDTKLSRSAGTRRGSRQNLNQITAKEKREERKPITRKDPKPKSDSSTPVPGLSDDERDKIFSFLLKRFDGRTKLGTFMSQKGDLLKGLSHEDATKWLKRSNRFLTFEKNGVVKFVSISYKEARSCFKYKKHNTDKCVNDNCPFFHICRDFIAGCCPSESSCHFNHSFHKKSNAEICNKWKLWDFTDEEIRTIVFRSSPAVCTQFNEGSCKEDCPDIHTCSKFLRDECSDDPCKVGHLVKGPEHNNWVLETFHMHKIPDHTLRKMVIAPQSEPCLHGINTKPALPDSTENPKKPPLAPKKAKTKQLLLNDPETSVCAKPGMQQELAQGTFLANPEMKLPTTFLVQTTTSVAEDNLNIHQKTRVQIQNIQRPDTEAHSSGSSVGPGVPPKEAVPRHLQHNHGQADSLLYSSENRLSDDRDTGLLEEQKQPSPKHRPRAQELPQSTKAKSVLVEEQQPSLNARPRTQQTPKTQPRPRSPTPSRAVAKDSGGTQRQRPAGDYAQLCEQYTWKGKCSKNDQCSKYHHMVGASQIWQVRISSQWRDFSSADNYDMEKGFCELASCEDFQVFLDEIGGANLSLDFNRMRAQVVNTFDSCPSEGQRLRVRRLSTPSYVEAEYNTPLSFYTQWCWYRTNDLGRMLPFESDPQGTLQYTLEEKYMMRQENYQFEVGEEQFVLHLKKGVLVNQNNRREYRVLRRPLRASKGSPVMSPLLLSEPPPCHYTDLPAHWSSIDHYQDFEMVELDSSGTEYLLVARTFQTTTRGTATILRVFRVQNPGLWDKYCSAKRSMAARYKSKVEVDERNLFHGTTSFKAAQGICANNIDFRRSGQNVGALYGRGAYFSTTASYSRSYTCGPAERYMFLAKVLLGKFTKGEQSYTLPPAREGQKLYDSCVDEERSPTIFVIFDLVQSYPEYLIQFEDAMMESTLGQ